MSSSDSGIFPSITVGGQEYASPVAEVIATAFSSSFFTAYLLRSSDSTWPTDQIPPEIIKPHFQKNVLRKVELGAELVEAGNFAAVAVWIPPGKSIPDGENLDPRIREFRDKISLAKKEHLQGREYWYLNLIGRHPERSEPGVVRALIDPYLKRAREEGIPVWLEAISEHARQVYEHLSFRTVAKVRVGVGKANSRGELYDNGEGLIVYGMLAE